MKRKSMKQEIAALTEEVRRLREEVAALRMLPRNTTFLIQTVPQPYVAPYVHVEPYGPPVITCKASS